MKKLSFKPNSFCRLDWIEFIELIELSCAQLNSAWTNCNPLHSFLLTLHIEFQESFAINTKLRAINCVAEVCLIQIQGLESGQPVWYSGDLSTTVLVLNRLSKVKSTLHEMLCSMWCGQLDNFILISSFSLKVWILLSKLFSSTVRGIQTCLQNRERNKWI